VSTPRTKATVRPTVPLAWGLRLLIETTGPTYASSHTAVPGRELHARVIPSPDPGQSTGTTRTIRRGPYGQEKVLYGHFGLSRAPPDPEH